MPEVIVKNGIEWRGEQCFETNELENILKMFDGTTIRDVRILIKYTDDVDEQVTENFIYAFKRLSSIIVHSAPLNKTIETKGGSIFFTTEVISDEGCCCVVSPSYFTVNTRMYVEAKNFNSCLNRKISIDVNGNIKNCPSLKLSYGNIESIGLTEVVRNNEFTKLWGITKDQVDICKFCEFRYICIDCRAYLQEPANLLSKPQKCKYDPFEAVWNN